ncbi:hypothetical protein NUM3379_15350 [Kineococcus sp. NUM-3379]
MERRVEQHTLHALCELTARHGVDLCGVLDSVVAAVTALTGAAHGALSAPGPTGHEEVLVQAGDLPGAPGDLPQAPGARLGVPVHADSRQVATLWLTASPGAALPPGAERAAGAAATTAGIAVTHALLSTAERTARERAEDREAAASGTAGRIALLQRITALLSTSATTADITARVPAAIVEALGCDSAALYLHDPAHGVLVGTGHPPLPPAVQARLGVVPVDAATPVGEAAHTRRAVTFSRQDAGRYAGLGGLEPGSVSSGLAVPMLTPDRRLLGVLNVNWTEARPRTNDDIALFGGVVAQVTLAVERAKLLDAERAARVDLASSVNALTELARTLQRGLLPRSLPSLERVDVAVRYQPAVVGAEVGGDWYDAIETDGAVVFVIGDVQGHSTTAAGLMGQLRTAVRAYVTEGHGPAAVLERTNRLLVALGDELFATCCLVQLDQDTGDVTVATAGHPLPLARDERGLRELHAEPGPPLGVVEGVVFEQSAGRLHGRGRVVLYTDGVVESVADQLDSGTEALRRSLSDGADLTCEDLATAIMASIPHRLDDDAAMLVLEYAGPVAERDEATLPLPADLRSVADARAFLRTALRAWGGDPLSDTAELVLTELVTNALVHTDGDASVGLRYDRDGKRLLISVQDTSTRRPTAREAAPGATGGRGLAIVGALAQEWGVAMEGDGKSVWAEVVW